jgi:hypothetical protein
VFIVIQKPNSNKVFLSYLILLIIDLGFENEQACTIFLVHVFSDGQRFSIRCFD